MGVRTGVVVGQEVRIWKGSDLKLRILNVQLLGDDPEEVEWFDITGEDTAPVNGDRVVVWEFAQNYKVAVLTKDLIIASVNPGERKFYSRDSDGLIVATIYLKDDGTLQIDTDLDLIANVGGDLTTDVSGDLTATVLGATSIDSTGDFDITAPNVNITGDVNIVGDVDIVGNQTNDGTLDVTGDISTEGDVSADGDVNADALATFITLLTHFHQGNLGFPVGPPISSGGGTTPSTPPSTDSSGDLITGVNEVSLDDHDHDYSWSDLAGSGTTDPPNIPP